MKTRITRRSCLKAAAAAGALTVLPSGLVRGYAANEKLSIGCVGSGIGAHNAKMLADLGENIAALCEVDKGRLEGWGRSHPGAKQYVDFRKMLDEVKLDGIVVATPITPTRRSASGR